MAKGGKDKITVDPFLSSIRRKDFAPVYFFFGEEDFLIDEIVDAVVAEGVDPATKGFNLDIIHGSETDGTFDCTAVGFGIFGSPAISATVNAGTTWTSEAVPSSVGVLTGVSCSSPAACHAVSDAGDPAPSILATADGGATWSPGTPRYATNFTSISCSDSLSLHRSWCLARRSECRDPLDFRSRGRRLGSFRHLRWNPARSRECPV